MIRPMLLIILQVCPSGIVVKFFCIARHIKFSCIARHIKFKNLSMLDHAEGSSANLCVACRWWTCRQLHVVLGAVLGQWPACL